MYVTLSACIGPTYYLSIQQLNLTFVCLFICYIFFIVVLILLIDCILLHIDCILIDCID